MPSRFAILTLFTVAACGRSIMDQPSTPESAQQSPATSNTCTPAFTVLTPASGGAISESNGAELTITSGGDIQENGSDIPGGGGSSAATYVDGVVYGQDGASGAWYAWNGTAWTSAGDPTAGVCPPQQTVTTLHAGDGGQIRESDGTILTISADGAIQQNGVDIPGGEGSAAVAYVDGVVWGQDARSGAWYAYQNGQWQGPQASPGATTPPPVNPPSQTTGPAAVLAYLQSITGKHAVSFQFIETGPLDPIEAIHDSTGAWLGGIGLDYFHFNVPGDVVLSGNAIAKDYWNAGGLVTLTTSMPNPQSGNGVADTSYVDADAILQPGTAVNAAFMHTLDGIADGLTELRDAGVVVIYRAYHEVPGPWFWWGSQNFSAAQFRRMWQFTHDYFVNQRGLTNLLWLYCSQDPSSGTAYYPGDAYVDIVGQDVYSDDPGGAGAAMYAALESLGKVVALSEFGPGDPSGGDPSFDEAVLVNALKGPLRNSVFWQQWWDGNAGRPGWGMAEAQNVAAALADPWVVNRDDLPSFR